MPSDGSIAIFVARFPTLTETFVAREIRGLQREGLSVHVWPCEQGRRRWRPTLRGPLRSLVPATPRGLLLAARAKAIADGLDDDLPADTAHLHAHFLHLPALVAAELAARRRIGFSVSAHARDIFVPEVDRAAICDRARFVSVCSQHALAALRSVVSPEARPRLSLHRHGLPLEEHPPVQRTPRERAAPFHVLTVGRLVEKKGLDDLISGITIAVEAGIDVRWRLIGGGPLDQPIGAQLDALGLRTRVELTGARPTTPRDFAWAHAFALGCRQAEDGDRDGVPNSAIEAMASGIPAILGSAGGTPELVDHLRTGWLADGADRASHLAEGLIALGSDPQRCEAMGREARAHVEQTYAWEVTLPPLCALLRAHVERR